MSAVSSGSRQAVVFPGMRGTEAVARRHARAARGRFLVRYAARTVRSTRLENGIAMKAPYSPVSGLQ
jgi:hypothetical protein